MKDEARSPDIIPHLRITRGLTVADLGAGGGYFSVKIAREVGPKGRVFAVDIDPDSLQFIIEYAGKEGAANVETVAGTFEDLGLKEHSTDMVFIRNAYHDFKGRVDYFRNLRKSLRNGGRIVVIDYDPKKLCFIKRLFGHSVDERVIIDEMGKAGYRHIASHSFLPEQSFNIFSPE
ncbi:MAG: class I SAM-dependent methyltransferase [Chrysiogenales bacterium]|nr:MAG: class I SAM-dependent methyltransferase [Chrysiogenales bacterium]